MFLFYFDFQCDCVKHTLMPFWSNIVPKAKNSFSRPSTKCRELSEDIYKVTLKMMRKGKQSTSTWPRYISNFSDL